MTEQVIRSHPYLSGFDPIGLTEANAQAELMRRVDAKYVIPPSLLPALLAACAETYNVLEVEDKRITHYQSVYYDTPGLDLYHAHHAGAGNRVKFRVRTYVESALSYYEEKARNNQGITDKQRVQLQASDILPGLLQLSKKQHPRHLQTSDLQPTLQVDYDRITLVSKINGERITIDLQLSYQGNGQTISFDDRVIVEVKHERGGRSRVHEILRRLGVRPGSISKYCLGILLVYPQVKQNRFKLPLRILAKQLLKYGSTASIC